jgi:hypothetical protein
MSNFWKRLRNRLFAPPPAPEVIPLPGAPPVVPAAPLGAGWPSTYQPAAPNDGAHRARVFDPALRHFGRAFRPGDPTFENDDLARQWAGLRRLVADHVLRAIAESEWGERLILRGSRLLKAWLGDDAREPGDLDWLVDPPTLAPDAGWGPGLRDGLVAAVFARPAPTRVALVRNEVAVENIWTYERAEGRRVVFPWRAAGLPGGAVQVDVVFRESVAEPDRRLAIPAADGGCISVRAAGPAQALAWKLVWLATDGYPQGKDLYDAVLLAERTTLPRAVLERTFQLSGERMPRTVDALVGLRGVDWTNFRTEYPWVDGRRDDWLARLAKAIKPVFTEARAKHGADEAPDGADPMWLTTTVVQLARGIDAERACDRLPILADALQDAGCTDEDILNHCRCGGPHTRGCWVVDLILGK